MKSNHYNRKWYKDMAREYYIISDEKSAGNGGGKYQTKTVWQKRDLNTMIGDTQESNAVLSNSQIILQKGFWFIDVICPAYKIDAFRIRLYDVTNDQQIIISNNAYSGNQACSWNFLKHQWEVTAQTTYQIEIWGTDNYNNEKALGVPVSIPGENERYTVVELYKKK